MYSESLQVSVEKCSSYLAENDLKQVERSFGFLLSALSSYTQTPATVTSWEDKIIRRTPKELTEREMRAFITDFDNLINQVHRSQILGPSFEVVSSSEAFDYYARTFEYTESLSLCFHSLPTLIDVLLQEIAKKNYLQKSSDFYTKIKYDSQTGVFHTRTNGDIKLSPRQNTLFQLLATNMHKSLDLEQVRSLMYVNWIENDLRVAIFELRGRLENVDEGISIVTDRSNGYYLEYTSH